MNQEKPLFLTVKLQEDGMHMFAVNTNLNDAEILYNEEDPGEDGYYRAAYIMEILPGDSIEFDSYGEPNGYRDLHKDWSDF